MTPIVWQALKLANVAYAGSNGDGLWAATKQQIKFAAFETEVGFVLSVTLYQVRDRLLYLLGRFGQ